MPKAHLTAAPNAGSPTSFRFTSSDSAGRPARWDPCTPIRWALNPDEAPSGALTLAEEAVRRLGAASGLAFSFVGTSTFKPLDDAGSAYPTGVDAVIAFATASEYPDLTVGTFGLGGFTSAATNSGPRIGHGGVVLNAAVITGVADGFGPGQRRGGALLHELGHMVGLDHVDDTSQIMNPSITTASPADYAAGDSAGLARVGRAAGCFPASGA